MFTRELRQFDQLLVYLTKLLADLPEEDLKLQPVPKVNTPYWILGHLCTANDFTLKRLGQPPIAPEDWGLMFGPGSRPRADLEAAPTRAEIWDVFNRGHALIKAAASQPDAAAMDRPHGIMFFENTPLATTGDLVSTMLTTHFAGHLGQLSAWRRFRGLKGVR